MNSFTAVTLESDKPARGHRSASICPILTKPLRLASLIAFVLCVATASFAQNSLGSISGTVKDPRGLNVVDASVTVLRPDTGVSIKTKTNKDGAYDVPSLVPGQYQVIIEKTGFDRLDVNEITVESAGTATVDGHLKVGNVSETVNIAANSEMLSTQSSTVATNMGEELTGNLPYPEQGSLEAALLAPGVRGSQNSPSGLMSENPGIYTGNVEPGAQIAINGATAGHTALLVDGSDVTQTSYSRAGVTVSSGMVGQVTVISNGVPAQYGRTMGGVVISTTKSGTNAYHGDVRWRHTDPFLQAHPDGQAIPAELHQNFFGLFLGGPVRIPHLYDGRDKTFFFFGFEPARLSNKTTAPAAIPTPDEIAGRFHNDLNLINQSILKASGEAAALAAPRTSQSYFQAPTNAAGFPSGPQYANNRLYKPIPNDDVSAQLAQNSFAQFVLSQFPTPSNPQNALFRQSDGYYDATLNNVDAIRGVKNRDNRYSIRIDQVFGSSDRMYFRYTHTPVEGQRFGLFNVSSVLTPWQDDISNANNFIIDETHVFNGSLINEIKVSYLRNNQNRQEPPQSLAQDFAAKYGLTPATSGKGFPSMSGFGYNLGTSTIADVIDGSSQLQDDLTLVRGNHKFSFGVDLRRLQSNQYSNPGLTGGSYSFTGNNANGCTVATYNPTASSCTGGTAPAVEAFVLGQIGSFSNQTAQIPGYYRWQYYGTYFQDDWRILPRLTLNLGMRYEIETPRKEINGNQGFFVPGATGTLNLQGKGALAANGAFCFSGSCGLSTTMWPINYHGFEPRIGVAWNPIPKFTVRASYALLRVPLTGLNNTASPNFGVSTASISGTSGGQIPNQQVNYITNPVAGPFTSSISAFAGSKGPFFTVPSGFPISYVRQWNAVPYSQQWSFTTQYQILRSAIVEVGYNGAHGVHLFSNNSVPLNFPNLSTFFADIAAGANFGSSSAATANIYGICSNQVSGCTPVNETLMQQLLPYQNFFNQSSGASGASAQIGELNSRVGVSSYHSMYIAGTQRFDHGLTLQASFTWSKAIDDQGGDLAAQASLGFTGSIQNPLNPAGEKAVSDFDVPARFITGYVYLLPFGDRQKHKLSTTTKSGALNFSDRVVNTVFGDWSTGGIFRAESSEPFLPGLGANTTTGGAPGFWFSTASSSTVSVPTGIHPRPNIVPGVPCINPAWGANAYSKFNAPYINAAAFSVPGSLGAPAFGNAPRTMANCRSPRQINFDANLSKRIPVGGNEKRYVELQLSLFNAFNHPLFFYDGGATNSSSGNNGQIFTTYNAAVNPGGNTPAIPGSSYPVISPGFAPSAIFGTVNQTFTAQFSRYVQIGAAFYF